MSARLPTFLTVLAAVLAVGEFVSAIVITVEHYPDSQPAWAVVFGMLFLIVALLLRSRRTVPGTLMALVLCLFEVVEYPAWTRHNTFDWVSQTIFAILALTGLAVAIALLVTRWRSRGLTV